MRITDIRNFNAIVKILKYFLEVLNCNYFIIKNEKKVNK